MWKLGLHEPETWIMAGTSSSTIFSKKGYQGAVGERHARPHCPRGVGVRLQPTKPSVASFPAGVPRSASCSGGGLLFNEG